MRTVQESWDVIHQHLKVNQPELYQTLAKGASNEVIRQLETLIGHPLPEDYKTSLKIHNGFDINYSIFYFNEGFGMMSVEEIIKEINDLQPSDTALPIDHKNIPVFRYGNGNRTYLNVEKGSLMLSDHEKEPDQAFNTLKSFQYFIDKQAKYIGNGRIYYDLNTFMKKKSLSNILFDKDLREKLSEYFIRSDKANRVSKDHPGILKINAILDLNEANLRTYSYQTENFEKTPFTLFGEFGMLYSNILKQKEPFYFQILNDSYLWLSLEEIADEIEKEYTQGTYIQPHSHQEFLLPLFKSADNGKKIYLNLQNPSPHGNLLYIKSTDSQNITRVDVTLSDIFIYHFFTEKGNAYTNNSKDIRDSWTALLSYYQKKYPGNDFFNPGCRDEDLVKIEQLIQINLPEEVKTSFKICNGNKGDIYMSYKFLSIDEIINTLNYNQQKPESERIPLHNLPILKDSSFITYLDLKSGKIRFAEIYGYTPPELTTYCSSYELLLSKIASDTISERTYFEFTLDTYQHELDSYLRLMKSNDDFLKQFVMMDEVKGSRAYYNKMTKVLEDNHLQIEHQDDFSGETKKIFTEFYGACEDYQKLYEHILKQKEAQAIFTILGKAYQFLGIGEAADEFEKVNYRLSTPDPKKELLIPIFKCPDTGEKILIDLCYHSESQSNFYLKSPDNNQLTKIDIDIVDLFMEVFPLRSDNAQ